ncbi:MAG: hypothetical protein IPP97_08810 [Candidatus Obscuribacter sp.]|nr:hypothetical protein [Candidatus Obscuribacter sp.]
MSKGIMLATGQSLDLQVLQQRLGYIPAFLQAKGTLGYKMLSVANADFIEPFRGNDAYGDLLDGFDIAGQLKGRHPVNQSLYIWSKTALAQLHPAHLRRRCRNGAITGGTPAVFGSYIV